MERRYGGWNSENVPGALANLLFDLNRGAEAETILGEALANAVRNVCFSNAKNYLGLTLGTLGDAA